MRCPTINELPPSQEGRCGWPWTEGSPKAADTLADGSPWPRITVVTPSYNQGEFIEETIRSVLLQGYPDLEYIITDGGSTDNTLEVIKKYEPWLTYWVSEPDRGQSHAINKGFERATGEILCWLNSDDLFEPGALYKVAQAFSRFLQAVFAAGSCSIIDCNGKQISVKLTEAFSLTRLLSGGLTAAQPATFFKKEVIETIGALDETFHQSLDREFWVRIGLHYPPTNMACIDDVLAAYRYWPGCKTARDNERIIIEHKRILDRTFSRPDVPVSLSKFRKKAYSALFFHQAFFAIKCSHYHTALKAFVQSARTSPFYCLKLITRASYRLVRRVNKPSKTGNDQLVQEQHR